MAVITIDTKTKEIVMENIKRQMIEDLKRDGFTTGEAMEKVFSFDRYQIKGIAPKKADKKLKGVSQKEIRETLTRENDIEADKQYLEIMSQKIRMRDKITGEEKVSPKSKKPLYQNNFLIARSWYLDYLKYIEWKKECERSGEEVAGEITTLPLAETYIQQAIGKQEKKISKAKSKTKSE